MILSLWNSWTGLRTMKVGSYYIVLDNWIGLVRQWNGTTNFFWKVTMAGFKCGNEMSLEWFWLLDAYFFLSPVEC